MEGMGRMNIFSEFYKGKKVLVTGHTGFKGTWLCKILTMLGADIIGYSLESPTVEGWEFFRMAQIEEKITSIIGDIRDYKHLKNVFDEYQPEIVLHLAAQPLVLEGYKDPVGTYSTNVMGTVNILECVRNTSFITKRRTERRRDRIGGIQCQFVKQPIYSALRRQRFTL